MPDDLRYFEDGLTEGAKFWRRHGGAPALGGASVLDVGCGRGALCVQLARAGAARVVGLDTDPLRVEFAARNVRTRFPELHDRIEFRVADIAATPMAERFDYVVSKDTFEHLGDVRATLAGIRDAMKPGAAAFIGFGPLYRSPFGDHGWTHAVLPWAHLVLPERALLGLHYRKHGWRPASLGDIGLNRWRLAEFAAAFRDSGLEVAAYAVNRGGHPAYRAARALSRLPLVGELFAFNIYCTLRKPAV